MRCYISGQWIDYVDHYTPELPIYIKKAELAEKGIAPQKPGFWKKYRELIELVIRLEKEFKYTANYGVYDPEEDPVDTEKRRKNILKWEAELAKIEKEHPEVLKPKAEKPKPQIVNNYYLGTAAPQAKAPDAEPPKTKDAALAFLENLVLIEKDLVRKNDGKQFYKKTRTATVPKIYSALMQVYRDEDFAKSVMLNNIPGTEAALKQYLSRLKK